jgi:hypothetical protein
MNLFNSATQVIMSDALGQDVNLLEQIEAGEVHPIMAAFGLWQDELDLVSLADEIEANRHSQPSRPIKIP